MGADAYVYGEGFDLITAAVPYANLQWTRRYFAPGQFSMQVALKDYDPRWQWVMLQGRSEVGYIEKVRMSGRDSVMVTVSGYMAENLLNFICVYPRYTKRWPSAARAASDLMDTVYRNGVVRPDYDIPNRPDIINGSGGEVLRNDTPADLDFVDDKLGNKLYSMLGTRGASYKVEAVDYSATGFSDPTKRYILSFRLWEGLDRTASQSENPQATFSGGFGNIASKDVNIDSSAMRNYAIVPVDADDTGKERTTYRIDLMKQGDYRRDIVFDYRGEHPDAASGETAQQFEDRITQEVMEKMVGYETIVELDVTQVSDRGYMVDYDLGDICNVILEDIGVTMEARIVEVAEVFKAEGHSITLGFGNKRYTNIERAVMMR